MTLQVTQNLDLLGLLSMVSGIFAATYSTWKYIEAKRSPLNAIPTVGHSGILTSYITAFGMLRHSTEILQEGYDKYAGQPFKVATLSRWLVVVAGSKYINDICKAPDEVLSFREAGRERIQNQYTLGQKHNDDRYHITTIRSLLTRNIVSRFDDIHDEIIESFKCYIAPSEEWQSVSAYETLMHVICRTSNRYFVGLPLCRDPGYCSLNETFTLDVVLSSAIIKCFPDILRPLVGRYLTTVPKSVKRGIHYLGPTLEKRLSQEKLHGKDWAGQPNDLISWLLQNATQDHHRTIPDLVLRILTVNFVSIHTSTMTFTHSLFDLAIHPEYVKDMREEAENVIQKHGWTKAAMQKMCKIDSFLKESQRLNSIGSMLMTRKALKDWTSFDGTFIPAGTFIGVASDAMNKNEDAFPDASTFKGFRFAEMRNGNGQLDSINHQMVSLSMDHVVFGHGRHACPGRFFAVNEIKAMFAHILLNYDVKLEDSSLQRPTNFHLEDAIIPDIKAKVMFRKRRN
ncbi:hypothetical protein Ac2012v2_003533 [Leucoagaricus gongylophorus]